MEITNYRTIFSINTGVEGAGAKAKGMCRERH